MFVQLILRTLHFLYDSQSYMFAFPPADLTIHQKIQMSNSPMRPSKRPSNLGQQTWSIDDTTAPLLHRPARRPITPVPIAPRTSSYAGAVLHMPSKKRNEVANHSSADVKPRVSSKHINGHAESSWKPGTSTEEPYHRIRRRVDGDWRQDSDTPIFDSNPPINVPVPRVGRRPIPEAGAVSADPTERRMRRAGPLQKTALW